MPSNGRLCRVVVAALTGCLLHCGFAHAEVMLGQVDDFQDGSTLNWMGAGEKFMGNAAGGPGGAGDLYLEVTATREDGPGSRIGTFNDVQWAGDYIAAGITAIQVDMANFGETDLDMRIVFPFGLGGAFTSTVANVVPADGVWRSYVFGLTDVDLTNVGGGDDFNATLSNVSRVLFRHQSGAPTGIGGGTPVVGNLGLDNITAIPAPPAAALLLLAGLTGRRRRQAQA